MQKPCQWSGSIRLYQNNARNALLTQALRFIYSDVPSRPQPPAPLPNPAQSAPPLPFWQGVGE